MSGITDELEVIDSHILELRSFREKLDDFDFDKMSKNLSRIINGIESAKCRIGITLKNYE